LLQASSARLMYAKRLVSGGVLGACRDMCVRAVPACRVHGCGVDGTSMGAGRRCLATRVVGVC
jgi:hypothetical protein